MFNTIKKAIRASTNKNVPSVAGGGKVESIRYSEDHPGLAEVRVRHGSETKESKGGKKGSNLGFDNSPTSHVHVAESHAKGLKLGQRIHLRAHDGEYGEATSDEVTQ